ncbi:MAG: DUF1016 family protein [Sedimentisphaerales bacterium]|nr:DUF1016 family protein [Sedimentisphaerales bacterium]MBN2843211.1 DUF1016 family protein [Sedimentisphaerales bacterium]
MVNELLSDKQYRQWLIDIKQRVRQSQLKAATAVNSALIEFYWSLGADIVQKQQQAKWGSGFLQQLSKDLLGEFPDIKGFSYRNLVYAKQLYLFYCQKDIIVKQPVSQLKKTNSKAKQAASLIGQQIVAQLARIPWGHNVTIIQKCPTVEQALFYVSKTIENNWARSVLTVQIESDLYGRTGKAISNFENTLPASQSDLARELLKDPYNLDFLTLARDFNERELENGLIEHVSKFLMELGAGFAYMGKQVQLQVGQRDFFLDLLFYHTRLHCYVVIELKVTEFEPEYAGKLNFYIKAVDEQLRSKEDKPTIGILLCKGKDKVVVEYALSDINKPIGVSDFQLTNCLPDELKSSLPSIEQIEAELQMVDQSKL